MHTTITKNKNLAIIMDHGDQELVKDLLERHGGNDDAFLYDLLDTTGWLGNAKLFPVHPVDIGALTCAPIVADDVIYDDDGTVRVIGNVYWYPQYEWRHFGEQLLKHEHVIFQLAH